MPARAGHRRVMDDGPLRAGIVARRDPLLDPVGRHPVEEIGAAREFITPSLEPDTAHQKADDDHDQHPPPRRHPGLSHGPILHDGLESLNTNPDVTAENQTALNDAIMTRWPRIYERAFVKDGGADFMSRVSRTSPSPSASVDLAHLRPSSADELSCIPQHIL